MLNGMLKTISIIFENIHLFLFGYNKEPFNMLQRGKMWKKVMSSGEQESMKTSNATVQN